MRVDFPAVEARAVAPLLGCATGRRVVFDPGVPAVTVHLSHDEAVSVDVAWAALCRQLYARGVEVVDVGGLTVVRRILV